MGVFFINCSVQSGYRAKSFFFDGVPNPNALVVQDTIPIISKDDNQLVIDSLLVKKEIIPIAPIT